ncbi:MAG: serine/threonine protein kinase, partial [Clostridia bacterium]|nr:serine/threonine protein kinase [Clostridia bacterium]
ERLAQELAARLAAKPSKKECVGCGKSFTPKGTDNNLCEDCQADRGKVLDAVLRAMLGGMPAEAPAKPSPLKGYQKIKLLGKGGMGEVWKVRAEATGKFFALKTMLPEVAADANAKRLFLREAEVGKFLSHKNIVSTHQAGCANGVFYILMDLCEGGSVDGLMEKRGGKLPLSLATWIILQVLTGLDYVHHVDMKVPIQKGLFKGTADAHGIVHRDFKPGNIFLSGGTDYPIAMVADFGMAKAFDTAGLSRMTKSGTVMGTPVFMPRQQAIDFKYAKPEVDVWAAAASYYNMLTGQTPKNFRPGKNPWQIIVSEKSVPIRDRYASIPQPLATIIDKALEEQPAIGYSSAAALRRDIVAALPNDIKKAVKGVL